MVVIRSSYLHSGISYTDDKMAFNLVYELVISHHRKL